MKNKGSDLLLFIIPFSIVSAFFFSNLYARFMEFLVIPIYDFYPIFLPHLILPGFFFSLGIYLYFRKINLQQIPSGFVLKSTIIYLLTYVLGYTVGMVTLGILATPAAVFFGTKGFLGLIEKIKPFPKDEKFFLITSLTLFLWLLSWPLVSGYLYEELIKFLGNTSDYGYIMEDLLVSTLGRAPAIAVLIWQLVIAYKIGKLITIENNTNEKTI